MDVEVAVIGGGIVGLAIASEVAQKRQTVLIEKHENHGEETSSRNSEVIHAGIYYPKDSLKARFCVEGNKLIYDLCMKNNIPFKKIGKLIVVFSGEESLLETLLEKGKNNGAEGLEIIGREKIKLLEPNAKGDIALYSPSSGIVDVHALMAFLESAARSRECLFAYNSEVVGIEKENGSYKIKVSAGKENYTFSSRVVVNSAGLNADKIVQLVGIDTIASHYKLHYCKGEYFYVKNSVGKINHLVYPLPHENLRGLGIHSSLDMSGLLRLGPNAFYVGEIDYNVNESHRQEFFESSKLLFDFINEEDLSMGFAGIRPKLQGPNDDFRDFIINHETEKGFPGLINLLGIESPGLTASPAIAKHVSRIVDEILA